MKQSRTILLIAAAVAIIAAIVYFNRSHSGGPVPQPSSSAPGSAVQTYSGHGLSFQYPANYKVEVATDNPELFQIAVDSQSAPGVLTIRFNPAAPSAPVELNAISEETKRGMSEASQATVQPTRLRIGGKDVDGRELKSTILGFPFTDVLAVVQLGNRNYVVLTHTADEDKPKAKPMFDTVLSSLGPS